MNFSLDSRLDPIRRTFGPCIVQGTVSSRDGAKCRARKTRKHSSSSIHASRTGFSVEGTHGVPHGGVGARERAIAS